jgi:hypothetical protein
MGKREMKLRIIADSATGADYPLKSAAPAKICGFRMFGKFWKLFFSAVVASTKKMEEKILDLFACINLLVLQPVARNMLCQSNHGLGEQFGIGLSDFSSRHSLFQQGSQS